MDKKNRPGCLNFLSFLNFEYLSMDISFSHITIPELKKIVGFGVEMN